MLTLIIPPITQPLWDEEKEEFITNVCGNKEILQLEHSLISVSKWESKWKKPFFSKNGMTEEEALSYIECMTLNRHVGSDVYHRLTREDRKAITDYINDPMTASNVANRKKKRGSSEQVTSELIYYWMITLGIPVEFERWHLNRLTMLIQICNTKNTPGEKMSTREILQRNAAINEMRRAKFHSKG